MSRKVVGERSLWLLMELTGSPLYSSCPSQLLTSTSRRKRSPRTLDQPALHQQDPTWGWKPCPAAASCKTWRSSWSHSGLSERRPVSAQCCHRVFLSETRVLIQGLKRPLGFLTCDFLITRPSWQRSWRSQRLQHLLDVMMPPFHSRFGTKVCRITVENCEKKNPSSR